jgi:hypothetical protein
MSALNIGIIKEVKVFFFEKKKQNTFVPWAAARPVRARPDR